jgi:hypothetical protein
LRQSIAFDDELSQDISSNDGEPKAIREVDFSSTGAGSMPSRPGIKRTSSTKKKSASSRLSFGPGEIISGDAAEALDEELFTPKKTVPRRGLEPSSLRLSLRRDEEEGADAEPERPLYSKDYLNALKTSTPSTPKEMQQLIISDDDVGLDHSELEGATVVDTVSTIPPEPVEAYIPTHAEIREKKERRARFAQEQDFISLSDPGDRFQTQISLLPSKKKETRLVRDDEEVMEGFDAFVSDGRIALGKKAEREAKRQQRKMMALAIQDAEGSSSEASDDSEAERRAEYEAAQTRAGMDGLKRAEAVQAVVPPRVTPIPSLAECLQRLQSTLSGAEQELAKRSLRMGELEREKGEILAREAEVQRLLKEAGDRYASLRAETALPPVDLRDPTAFVPVRNAWGEIGANRGLESFGNTPVGSGEVEDVG